MHVEPLGTSNAGHASGSSKPRYTFWFVTLVNLQTFVDLEQFDPVLDTATHAVGILPRGGLLHTALRREARSPMLAFSSPQTFAQQEEEDETVEGDDS